MKTWTKQGQIFFIPSQSWEGNFVNYLPNFEQFTLIYKSPFLCEHRNWESYASSILIFQHFCLLGMKIIRIAEEIRILGYFSMRTKIRSLKWKINNSNRLHMELWYNLIRDNLLSNTTATTRPEKLHNPLSIFIKYLVKGQKTGGPANATQSELISFTLSRRFGCSMELN